MRALILRLRIGTFVLLPAAGCEQPDTYKNFVYIILDDLEPLIHVYKEAQIISPNIDRLMPARAPFTNAHAQQAVFDPSRVSLFTGIRSGYIWVWGLQTKMGDKRSNSLALPVYFKEKEHITVGLGKMLHGTNKNHVGDPRSDDVRLAINREMKKQNARPSTEQLNVPIGQV